MIMKRETSACINLLTVQKRRLDCESYKREM
jgi:hypothetical protein